MSKSICLDWEKALSQREKEGILRKLPKENNLIDFCSNDYLGFSKNLKLLENVTFNTLGSTGSRLITGNYSIAEETENFIAKYHNAEASLIYNSGYTANVGLLTAIGDRQTVFLYDEYIHASMIDGMRLSLSDKVKFKHNDIEDLNDKISKIKEKKVIILVESVYSMDGDISKLSEINEICTQHNAYLIVDEAHATGVLGEKGEGLVNSLKLESNVLAQIHTFGKALGLHGAAVVGSKLLKNYLINFSRPFIYTTALPKHTYKQIQNAYNLLSNNIEQKRLYKNINYFNELVSQNESFKNIISTNMTPIQYLLVNKQLDKISKINELLIKERIFAKVILYPTVPKGMERIRFCLHSFNSFEEIDKLLNCLENIIKL